MNSKPWYIIAGGTRSGPLSIKEPFKAHSAFLSNSPQSKIMPPSDFRQRHKIQEVDGDMREEGGYGPSGRFQGNLSPNGPRQNIRNFEIEEVEEDEDKEDGEDEGIVKVGGYGGRMGYWKGVYGNGQSDYGPGVFSWYGKISQYRMLGNISGEFCGNRALKFNTTLLGPDSFEIEGLDESEEEMSSWEEVYDPNGLRQGIPSEEVEETEGIGGIANGEAGGVEESEGGISGWEEVHGPSGLFQGIPNEEAQVNKRGEDPDDSGDSDNGSGDEGAKGYWGGMEYRKQVHGHDLSGLGQGIPGWCGRRFQSRNLGDNITFHVDPALGFNGAPLGPGGFSVPAYLRPIRSPILTLDDIKAYWFLSDRAAMKGYAGAMERECEIDLATVGLAYRRNHRKGCPARERLRQTSLSLCRDKWDGGGLSRRER